MLPRILPFAATVPSGPLPYVMSWVYVCPLASRIDHWARVEALCVLPDVLCSVTLTTRKMFPALGWSNSLPVLFFTELSVTVQSALTTTGLPIAFPAGAVVGAGVFPVAGVFPAGACVACGGVFVAPWLAARMPPQPGTAFLRWWTWWIQGCPRRIWRVRLWCVGWVVGSRIVLHDLLLRAI